MGNSSKKPDTKKHGWILFFYSVPSKPVNNRMKVWRKLIKAGAVQLKGAVYILPFSDEHYEFIQWLAADISEMKGEAAFLQTDKIDSINNPEIVSLFNYQRAGDYKNIEKSLNDLERKSSSIRKGAKTQNLKALKERFAKLLKDFEEIKRIDFFSSDKGKELSGRIKQTGDNLVILAEAKSDITKPLNVTPRNIDSYNGRIWVTRKRPFIDRMASAWLIKKFIDRNASFDFIEEKDIETLSKGFVSFDIRDGDFTHIGNLCTFEVLVKSFGFKDKTIRKIAEIVHQLDMKDDEYSTSEAAGLEDIFSGIRKSAASDMDALEKGISVFEMLYAAKT